MTWSTRSSISDFRTTDAGHEQMDAVAEPLAQTEIPELEE
jgi:hypothetical protein